MFPRALQNHLLQTKHLTTLDELWIPQYLEIVRMSVSLASCDLWEGETTHAHACGGSSTSSSALGTTLPLAPLTGWLMRLSRSSSS